MTVFEMAQCYYPRLWDENRLRQLVQAGKLSQEEVDRIMGKKEKNL